MGGLTTMSTPLEDGEEEGTSNNIYYFSIYVPVTYQRLAVERQNQLCKGVWLEWMKKYPGWQSLLVLHSRQPGPEIITLEQEDLRKQLTGMWDFLIGARVLPPRPRPIFAQYHEIADPPRFLVERVRDDISRLRGSLSDLASAYPLWREQLIAPQGGLTCVLSYLYDVAEDMEKHQARWGHNPDWLKPIDKCTGK